MQPERRFRAGLLRAPLPPPAAASPGLPPLIAPHSNMMAQDRSRNPMLAKLVIRNFKRFDNVEIPLASPVVFIGPNNSGKTPAL
jgi:hypothetical protein